MIACLIFVFCGLLEYALVNVACRTGVRVRTPIVRQASLRAALEHSDLISSPVGYLRSDLATGDSWLQVLGGGGPKIQRVWVAAGPPPHHPDSHRIWTITTSATGRRWGSGPQTPRSMLGGPDPRPPPTAAPAWLSVRKSIQPVKTFE